MPREEIAAQSHDLSGEINAVLTRYMPGRFVNDPGVELAEQPDLDDVVELVAESGSPNALHEVNAMLERTLAIFGVYGRSYIQALLPE